MTTNWTSTTIGDVCEVYDGPHATPVRTDTGPIFLGISSLNNGRIDVSKSDHVSEADFATWTRRVLPREGDVVFSYETRLGEVGLIPKGLRCCLGRRMGLLRVKDPNILDPKYLLYFYLGLSFQQTIVERTVHGSTVDRIPLIDFPSFPLEFPPIAQQRAVAHLLSTLDDKIELNIKTNETLEAIAQALFKSWFVDFDPVRAKAEGRPTHLPNDIGDLFPDSFEESELGMIPRGWTVGKAGDLYGISIGKTPPRKESQWFSEDPSDIPWVSIRDMGTCGTFIHDTAEYLTREAVERFNVKRIPDATVLVSFKLTVGRVAITDGEMLSNEAIAHFAARNSATPYSYTYCALKGYDYASLGSTSSIATAVNSQSLRDMLLLNPSDSLKSAFGEQVGPLLERIRLCQRSTACLQQLRDTLLPKLISGELLIPDEGAALVAAGV